MPVITEGPSDEPKPAETRGMEELGNGDVRKDGAEVDDDDDTSDMPPLEDFVTDSGDSNKNKGKRIVIDDEKPKAVDEDGWLDILGSGELKKKVIRKGEGQASRPQRSHWVVINLKGSLDDGIVFEEQTNLKIILGDLEIVSGLDISIALMEKNELAEIVVPPRFGYGELGRQPVFYRDPDVPPNATLHYQVELLDTIEPKEETDLPFHERQSIGDAKRERGNFWYGRGEYSNAAHCYRRALDFLDDMGLNLSESPPELQLLLDTRLKVYNNLTAAQMKASPLFFRMEAYEAALKSVDFVLRIQPNNVKALYRKGKILGSQGNVSEAVSVLKKALKLEPETKIIQQELARLSVKKQQEDHAEKAMYRRMFGGAGTSKPESRGARASKVARSWTWLAGGLVAVAAVSVAAYRHLAAA
ncbi:unnamed protein product [Ixodes hexagonus]